MRDKTWLLAVFLLYATSAWPQSVSSSVKGVVVDASQAGIGGAACVLTDPSTGRALTAASWADGSFTFPNVPSGGYTLKIEAAGFKTTTIRDVVVMANEVRTLGNLVQQLGEVKESVNVTAEGAVAAVQLASGEVSGLVTGEQLNNFALKGGDMFALLQLLPGVVDDFSEGRETITATSNRGTYINGGGAASKNYSVDGVYSLNSSNATTVVQPNLSAIAEVRVLTSNYQAEYGRMSSGVISVITKGGTREFHGSGWSNYRHEQLNARNYFENYTSSPRTPYRYRTYGYSIGGPVYIPRRFNSDRNKLFFFLSQQFDPITRSFGTQLATSPTERERAGDFSRSYDLNGVLVPVRDPLTRQYLPGNIVPASRFSKTGQAILNFFPLPNYTDPDVRNLYRYNLRSTYSAPYRLRNDVVRLDYNPLPSLTVSYRLMRNSTEAHPPWGDWKIANNFALTSVVSYQPGLSHLFNVTRIFSPTLVNETKFAYTLNNIHSDYDNPELVMRSRIGSLPQLYKDAGAPDFIPDMNFGGTPSTPVTISIGPGNWHWRGTEFTYTDNLSKVWRKHTLKAGFNIDHYRAVGMDTRGQWRGVFNFGRDSNNPQDANHGFANALVGTYTTYTELNNRVLKNTVLNVIEEYVQDNWRVTRRLTLDFGIRFVHQPPEYDLGNAAAHFDPALYDAKKAPTLYVPAIDRGARVATDPVTKTVAPAALIGLFVPNTGDPANGSRVGGVDGYPRGLFTRPWIFPAPRFGFAYDLFGTGRTALRGGFGIFYDTADSNSFESSAGNPPVSYTTVQYYGNLDSLAAGSGLLGPSTMSSQAAVGRIPAPMTMNFSLGIQHQIQRNIVVQAAYVGSQVVHRLMTREINAIPMYSRFDPRYADSTSPGRPLADNFLRPYRGYASITPYEMTGTSHYNSLQSQIHRRFAKGLQFGVSYTFSKVLGATSLSPYFPARQWNYGPFGQDRNHVFVANYMYQLPKIGRKTGFKPAGWVLDNWQISGVTSFITGAPFTPGFSTTDGQDLTGSGESARITVVGDPRLDKGDRTFYRNFNAEAFARTPLRSFGNAGVGILRGPGVNNWDLTIARTFRMKSDQRNLQFRAGMFNAWNHTQFSGLDTTARFNPAGQQTNPTFGAFTSARPPRIVQLSARFVF
jgi:hypothetical protein